MVSELHKNGDSSAVRKYVRVKRRSIAVAASQQNTEVLKVFLAPIISTMTNGSSSYSTISACLAAVFVAGLGAGMMLLTVIQQKRKDQNYKKAAPRRFGAAIRLVDYERYRELHDNVWPKVLERMQKSNIRNFSIHYHKETSTLFQYFEWIGHWKHNASSLDGCCLTKKRSGNCLRGIWRRVVMIQLLESGGRNVSLVKNPFRSGLLKACPFRKEEEVTGGRHWKMFVTAGTGQHSTVT